ncbi:NACHT and WD repeat domain-containing protein [Variovorax sp. YR216]|uniref:NACHT and WD repeat domain-containing protein n=1 Tax=Variovorax sp. YR216 TaxID=1882828 RepID=UPI00089C50A2|nr:NACHT and WD repeat domain-containing protein [Variovorax sp. YR216]SEB24316.1 WD40 repeat [Variovorax sp. YR216]
MNGDDGLRAANPFSGLRPFDIGEGDRFFGRGRQIDELAARLTEVTLLAVTGESGCGKSSLVRAGLIDRLSRMRDEAGHPRWLSAVLRPGDRPLAALATALKAALYPEAVEGDIEARMLGWLQLGGHGLIESVRMARLMPGQRLLVVIDQFEEVFRFELDPDEASAFVGLLLNAAQDRESPVNVVITMRTDALGSCPIHRGLPEAISRGQYLVPRMTRAQRTEAIVGPVETLRGRKIAARLVQRLLNDVSDQYDELPVLQHVLARSWDHWATTPDRAEAIDLVDYTAVGTAANALSIHGAEACRELPGLEAVIEKVFRALTVRIVDSGDPTRSSRGSERRPLPFERLRAVVGAPVADVEKVVERFRRRDTSFLMTGAPLALNPTIDIAHESLIRLWDCLQGWLGAEADAGKRINHLFDMAVEHRDKGGALLQERSLDEALEWRETQQPTAAWAGLYVGAAQGEAAWQAVQDYLGQSLAEREHQKQLLAAAQIQRRRRVQVRMAMAAGVTVVSLLIGLAGVDLARRARSRELASQSLVEREHYPVRAAHLALAAWQLDGNNENAHSVLRDTLAGLDIAHIERGLPDTTRITDVMLSPDRSRLLLIAGMSVSVVDSTTLAPLAKPFERSHQILEARLTGDNRTLLTLTDDSQVQAQAVDGGAVQVQTCSGEGNSVFKLGVSPVGAQWALGCYKGEVLVSQADSTGVHQSHAFSHRGGSAVSITALRFSWDGRFLASGDADGFVNLWRLEAAVDPGGRAWLGQSGNGKHDSPLQHHAGITALDFHPKSSKLLVSASEDGTARVWMLDTEPADHPPHRFEKNAARGAAKPGGKRDDKQALQTWLLPARRSVSAARILSPIGGSPYVLTYDGKEAMLWTSETPRILKGHEDFITDADAAVGAPVVVTASRDGTARLWVTRTGLPFAVLSGQSDAVARALFLSPDGSRVLTLTSGGQVSIWRVAVPRLLMAGDDWLLGANFSPDGRQVVVVGEKGAMLIPVPRASTTESKALPLAPLECGSNDCIRDSTSWSHDGRWIAGRLSSQRSEIPIRAVIWDASSGKTVAPAWLKPMTFASFCAGCDELLAVDEHGEITLWPSAALRDDDATPLARFGSPDLQRMFAQISPDGRWVVAINNDRLEVWSRAKSGNKPLHVWAGPNGHKGPIRTIAFSRDSTWVVSAGADRTARVWSLAAPESDPIVLAGSTSSLYSAAFDPGGERIATGRGDGRIDIWKFDPRGRSAERWVSMRRHQEGINSVEFSPDGEQLLSASDDGTVRLERCALCEGGPAQWSDRVTSLAPMSKEEMDDIDKARQIGWRDLWGGAATVGLWRAR